MRRLSTLSALGGVLLALACAAPNAVAQQMEIGRLQVEANGACKREELARLPELGPDRLVKGRGFTYVVSTEPRVRRFVNINSAPISAQPALFAPLVIYGVDGQSGSLFISFNNLQACGWIEPEAVLYERGADIRRYARGPRAVTVEKGPDGPNHPGNELDLKVVLQNLNKDLREQVGRPAASDPSRQSNRGVPILKSPGMSTETPGLDLLKLFYVFEVFDWKKAPDPDAQRQERIYYLIGRRGEPSEGGKLEGWVHQDYIYVWTSRIAAFWAKTGQAKGYAKRDRIGIGQHAIQEPPASRLREPPDKTVQRFPVIEQFPETAELSRRAVRLMQQPNTATQIGRDIDRMIEHYYIATPACPEPAPGARAADSECTSQDVDDIDERRRRLKNIDIMFLMDATQSMEPYFPAARQALEAFVGKLHEQQRTNNIRAGITIYGDYTTDEPDTRELQYNTLLVFQELANLKSKFGLLNNVKMYSDRHNDRPEASFAALMKAGQSPYWGGNSGIRYLVHIGDHGNREKGRASGTNSKLIEKFSEEDVVKELLPKGIIYVAIPVLGTFSAPDNGAFVRQAQRLRTLMPKQSADVRPTYSPGQPVESQETRVSAILRALEEGVGVSDEVIASIDRSITCAQNPQNPICAIPRRETGGWQAEVVRGLEINSGLTPEQIRRVYGQDVTVGTFYFKPHTTDGSKQLFNFYLSLEETPLGRLTRVVGDLCKEIDKSDGARQLLRAIESALDVTIDNRNDSLADLVAKRLFVPAYHLNPLLLKPWDDMENVVRHAMNTPRMDAMKRDFCKSATLLAWAKDGLRLDPAGRGMTWQAAEKVWKPVDDRDLKPYSWKQGGGTSVPLFYIPLEFLPGTGFN
jgi:hypothetical protein